MNQITATIRPMPQRIRNLIVAGAAALTMATIPVVQAQAAPQPNLCVAYVEGTGEVIFFLPGERAKVNGQKVFCGSDGQWHPDYSALQTPPAATSSPKLASVGSSNLFIR
jgi:hypothetical protein